VVRTPSRQLEVVPALPADPPDNLDAATEADPDDYPLDTMSLFGRDVPKGPLLTGPQELALARRMRGEDVVVPRPGAPRPTPQQAHDRLVEQNLRLVLSIARKYQNRGLPVEDLVQEGALGLRHAAEKFDPDKGWRFSTYATWWVRQAVTRALGEQSRTVRVPVHMLTRATLAHRVREQLREHLGRLPTADEVAAEAGLTAAQVDEALASIRTISSLDKPFGEDGESTLGDLLPDGGAPTEAIAEEIWRREAVETILGALTPRERVVLEVRFGIGRDRQGTLEEAGAALGVTRERARQLEADAFRRLRGARAVALLRD
jgi:RNA polymerase primary sigma factor